MEIIEVGATAYKGILDQNTYVLIKNDGAVIIDAGSELVDVKKAVQGKKEKEQNLNNLGLEQNKINSILKFQRL